MSNNDSKECPECVCENDLNRNPGAYSKLHSKCKAVLAAPFELYNFVINGRVSPSNDLQDQFQVTVSPADVSVGGTIYADNFNCSYTSVISDEAHEVNGSIASTYKDASVRLNANVRDDIITLSGSLSAQYEGTDHTSTVDLEADVNGLNMKLQLFQSLSDTIAVGGDVVYDTAEGQPSTIVSVGARYMTPERALALSVKNFSTPATNLTYYENIFGVHLGIEVVTKNIDFQKATIGYKLECPEYNAVWKQSVDTNKNINCVLNWKCLDIFDFTFCAQYVLENYICKLGFGFVYD